MLGRTDNPRRDRSRVTGERLTAVIGDHVGQRRDNVDVRALRLKVPIRPVEVADDPLRVQPVRVLAEIRRTGGR